MPVLSKVLTVKDANNFADRRNLNLQNFIHDHRDYEINTCASLSESHHFSVDELFSRISRFSFPFNVLSLNIECLNAKWEDLLLTLNFMKEKDCYPSIIALQETWLEYVDSDYFSIQGFEPPIFLPRYCGAKGGLIVYVGEGFTYSELELEIKSTYFESLSIEIKHKESDFSVAFTNVYRPPRGNNNNDMMIKFIEDFKNIVDHVTNNYKNSIICGDFNIDLLKIDARSTHSDFLDLFLTNGYTPMISRPTRFTEANATLIDNIFLKSEFSNHFSANVVRKISDHIPIFLSIDINMSQP